MIVPTCRCAFFAAVMLLEVFMSDIAPAKTKKKYSKDMGFTMGVSLDMVGCTRGSNYKMEISPV